MVDLHAGEPLEGGGRDVVIVADAQDRRFVEGLAQELEANGQVVLKYAAGHNFNGSVRDIAGVLGTGLPVWCQGAAAPPSVAGLTFVSWQEPIGCGGVAVFPDDVVVVDDDGAVLIPQALVEAVAQEGTEQERLEGWIMSEVERGVALPGLYPPNDEAKARYAATKK